MNTVMTDAKITAERIMGLASSQSRALSSQAGRFLLGRIWRQAKLVICFDRLDIAAYANLDGRPFKSVDGCFSTRLFFICRRERSAVRRLVLCIFFRLLWLRIHTAWNWDETLKPLLLFAFNVSSKHSHGQRRVECVSETS